MNRIITTGHDTGSVASYDTRPGNEVGLSKTVFKEPARCGSLRRFCDRIAFKGFADQGRLKAPRRRTKRHENPLGDKNKEVRGGQNLVAVYI